MISYLILDSDFTLSGKKYELNEIYESDDEYDVYDIYINALKYTGKKTNVIYAIIEVLDNFRCEYDTIITNKFKIIRWINKFEMLNECKNNIYNVESGEYHFKNSMLHSENDLPAIIMKNGDQYWYKYGLIHRLNDQPAIIYTNESKEWYVNGVLHRLNDLPAVITRIKDDYDDKHVWYDNGNWCQWNYDSVVPFVEFIFRNNENKEWYVNGKLHRYNDRPAIVTVDGDQFWYKHGKNNRGTDNEALWFVNKHREYRTGYVYTK